jgi:maltooligosyltrehalose trehalohydrolase
MDPTPSSSGAATETTDPYAKSQTSDWRLDLGAEPTHDGVSFRVWAPQRKTVEVILESEGRTIALEPQSDGYFSAMIRGLGAGCLYRYRLDGQVICPDPCSRFQPKGPHGPSMVADPNAFVWSDQEWKGIELHGQIMYELHIGTFTPEGTFDAAAEKLDALKDLGITVIEVMPVAECPGRWNWGYDGVDLFAPSHNYGDYEALKRFVDRAHSLGLGVVLDVVYNHVGPDSNYLKCFSKDYFTNRYETDWGPALNFDGDNSTQVRNFFIQNACYWISEFHLDGLRLDATQNIYDAGPVHVLAEISRRSRRTAGDRRILLIAENEPQDVTCLKPVEDGGYGLDAIWNDDFHHASRVALTGHREAYFTDYQGTAQELVALAKRGFLFQGQYYQWQKQPRGSWVTNESAAAFVFYLQNHDKTANLPDGRRLEHLSNPAAYRALTALLLLSPATPLLFMGQEFEASAPWVFFADHKGNLARTVLTGRQEFLAQFPSYGTPEAQQRVPDPALESTFERCKLNWVERESHKESLALHCDLLRMRRDDPVLARQSRAQLDGAVFNDSAFVMRFFGGQEGDRLLLINLGAQLNLESLSEPLLAPVSQMSWHLLWSSDAPRYGGRGIVNPYKKTRWSLPALSATVFSSIQPAPPISA